VKKALFDTNIILDVLLDRHPHAEASAAAWGAVEHGRIEGLIAAHAVPTVYYIVRRGYGNAKAKSILSSVLKVFRVAGVDDLVIVDAMTLRFADFEDAVTAAAARSAGCDHIVTRDVRGFRDSPVRPIPPESLVLLL